ncbi:hypothetical protein NA78x_002593 [Anatilimnocola sp. NA78]|uniref:hypothetical protein n=1 Tax=Anatilimnocola sp. NA78 TaxID=3415683 RepID=UPI003CE51743
MGHELYYETSERHIGSMSLRRWDEVHKLLPLLVDYLNRAMRDEWEPGTARGVRIMHDGSVAPAVPPPDEAVPDTIPFDLGQMLSTQFVDQNYIYFNSAPAWKRLFAWCDFLQKRDGAFELYAPLALTLRRALSAALSGS